MENVNTSERQITIRAGIPQISGHLVQAAHSKSIPVLFSANAFARTTSRPGRIGPFRLSAASNFAGFNLTAAKRLPEGLDAALDSAGFVAANRYGCYRWDVKHYYDLVCARNWTWHAAMDYCMEPQVAGAKIVRMIRLNATAQGYRECVNEARRRDAPLPMPVIQGWEPEDYLRCIDLLGVDHWPALVGIGSVCRRNVSGRDGIASIVDALDTALPKHVRFHLFGVKGGALRDLGDHPRFGSIDSMAWDFSARCARRTGRTQAYRASAMCDWHGSQTAVVPRAWAFAGNSVFPSGAPEDDSLLIDQAVVDWYYEHLADHGYEETTRLALAQASQIRLKVQHFGIESLQGSDDMAEMAAFEALNSSLLRI
jgi:hypothetical protein